MNLIRTIRVKLTKALYPIFYLNFRYLLRHSSPKINDRVNYCLYLRRAMTV